MTAAQPINEFNAIRETSNLLTTSPVSLGPVQRDVMVSSLFEHADTERLRNGGFHLRNDAAGRQGGLLLQFVTVFTRVYQ